MQRRNLAFSVCLGLALMLVSSMAVAQYNLINLDSNQIGKAAHADPLIVNAWGLVHAPGSPWWVSDNLSGWSTLYTGAGKQIQQLKVLIPTAGNGPDSGAGMNGPGSPTGVVFNGSNEFQVQGWASIFLFATLDGTISGWAPQSNFNQAILGVDTSTATSPASYTGLAITNKASGNRLFAADMANGKIDVYDGNFAPVTLGTGAFADPTIPADFAPFGIADINGLVYVTYASKAGAKGGFVNVYSEDGVLGNNGTHLIQGGLLNQPWGLAFAPKNFGPLSNTLLVTNNTNNGVINAYNVHGSTAQFVGTVKDVNGKVIQINQLWGIGFGDGMGGNGQTNQLFFTAGPSGNLAGTFGMITFK